MVVLVATHPEEFPLKPLVRLLESGKDDCSCHSAEANSEVFPRVFGLKEMEENIYRGGMAKVITKNGEGPDEEPAVGPDEEPAVGMQLGRGDVYLS